MRIAMLLIISCLAIISVPPSVYAAAAQENQIRMNPRAMDNWRHGIERYAKEYDELLRKIYKEEGELIYKVELLRNYYQRSKQYDPFSKKTLTALTQYAQIAQESDNLDDKTESLLAYKALLRKHLANYDILLFARTMSMVDAKFGNTAFYTRMIKALVQSFYTPGEGRTPARAYYITTYGEEDYILKKIGGKVDKSEIYNTGRKYYNVHDITLQDGSYAQIYMDVTAPIVNLQQTKRVMGVEGAQPKIPQ